MPQRWIRFAEGATVGFGTIDADTITVHEGDMLAGTARSTSRTVARASVRILTPTLPTKMIGLWNNFGALAEKMQLATPPDPLYFFKAPSSFLATGEKIRQPKFYDGRVVFEAELGIVIGKTCKDLDEAQAATCIFGYTCINDVTGFDVLFRDTSFPQWARSKSYDTFGVFGPVVTTGLDPAGLVIRALLDGEERQNYPVSDMTMKPVALVSRLSQDMTLCPGDVIACGTSVGAGRMKSGCTIEIAIDGIGTLRNQFE